MGRDGARPSRGKQMVRNGHWNFDRDLEGARSLGAGNPVGTMFSSRGCKGLQPSRSMTFFREGWRPCRPNFLLVIIIRAN